jgi:hypothetical protein
MNPLEQTIIAIMAARLSGVDYQPALFWAKAVLAGMNRKSIS